jgi:hypothetical protein
MLREVPLSIQTLWSLHSKPVASLPQLMLRIQNHCRRSIHYGAHPTASSHRTLPLPPAVCCRALFNSPLNKSSDTLTDHRSKILSTKQDIKNHPPSFHIFQLILMDTLNMYLKLQNKK